ncbi:Calx-beta domain-containing protein, partial [Croceivirga thetidis]
MRKKIAIIFVVTVFGTVNFLFGQDCTAVVFGDGNLETFLLDPTNSNNIRDINGDPVDLDPLGTGSVCAEEAELVAFLSLSGANPDNEPVINTTGIGITSLVGLEAFTNLRFLYAQNNPIINIDLRANLELIDFRGFDGNTGNGIGTIQTVDLRGLTNLEVVGLNNNVINSLLLENNSALRILNFSNNQLSGDFDFSLFDTQLVLTGALALGSNPGPFCIEVSDKVNADTRVANGDWFVGAFDETIFQDTPCNGVPLATIAATDADAVENPADPGTFTVTLDQANNSGGDIFVNYTVGGTATEGTDYTTLVGSVTIANGATTGTVSIDPLDDALVEGPETV